MRHAGLLSLTTFFALAVLNGGCMTPAHRARAQSEATFLKSPRLSSSTTLTLRELDLAVSGKYEFVTPRVSPGPWMIGFLAPNAAYDAVALYGEPNEDPFYLQPPVISLRVQTKAGAEVLSNRLSLFYHYVALSPEGDSANRLLVSCTIHEAPLSRHTVTDSCPICSRCGLITCAEVDGTTLRGWVTVENPADHVKELPVKLVLIQLPDDRASKE